MRLIASMNRACHFGSNVIGTIGATYSLNKAYQLKYIFESSRSNVFVGKEKESAHFPANDRSDSVLGETIVEQGVPSPDAAEYNAWLKTLRFVVGNMHA
jgi:hypothetical protein